METDIGSIYYSIINTFKYNICPTQIGATVTKRKQVKVNECKTDVCLETWTRRTARSAYPSVGRERERERATD